MTDKQILRMAVDDALWPGSPRQTEYVVKKIEARFKQERDQRAVGCAHIFDEPKEDSKTRRVFMVCHKCGVRKDGRD